MARTIGSWLSGSGALDPDQGSDARDDYPGERLGFPERGSRSQARMGRRLAALTVDWLIAYGIGALLMNLGVVSMAALSTTVLGIWFVLGVLSVRLFSFTPGQFALGLVVISVDGRPYVSVGRAIGRGMLITLVIPALFTDSDLRGLQDLATKTAVVRR